MTFLTKFIPVAACVIAAGPALAQSDSGAAPNGADKTPDTITCAEIATLDTAVVPGVLYFIAGYQRGSGSGMQGDTNSADSQTSGSSQGAEIPATESETLATEDSNTGATTSSAESSATPDTDLTAAVSGNDNTADTSSSDQNTASATAQPQGDLKLMRVAGLYEIPVEEVLTLCGETPEGKVGEVMKQKSDGEKSRSN